VKRLALLATLASAAAVASRASFTQGPPPRAVARVGAVEGGRALVRDARGETRPAKAGLVAYLGESVENDAKARSSLKLADGVELRLGPGARVVLERATPETRVRVVSGLALVRVIGKRAPGASAEFVAGNARVAPTDAASFYLCFDPESRESFAESSQGRVSLVGARGSPVALAPGERGRVLGKGAPRKSGRAPAACRR
jgi:ferric-dicitrate binding protein FerR (iron transport regulator)